jgi:hypothetical protein
MEAGDSNPKRAETEQLHNNDKAATDCNEKPLEGIFEKQNQNSSEHFQTLSQQQLGANMVHMHGRDPNLAEIVTAWPGLPGPRIHIFAERSLTKCLLSLWQRPTFVQVKSVI